MTLLSAQLRLIYEVMEADKNNYDNYNDIITFWQEIREMLLDYTEPIALPMVITCKTLALQLIHNQMEKVGKGFLAMFRKILLKYTQK